MMVRPAASTAGAISGAVRLVPVAALLVPLFTPASAQAQKPADIINRMKALYNGAKTYRATMVVRQSGKTPAGQSFAVTNTRLVQYKSPNRFRLDASTTGTVPTPKQGATPQNPAFDIRKVSETAISISNGKTTYIYSPSQKKYAKKAAPTRIPLPSLLSLSFGEKTPVAKLLRSETINGRPAFVLEVRVDVPPQMPAAQRDQLEKAGALKFVTYIDKQNYQMLRLTGRGLQVDIKTQDFKANIADTAFNWSPPPGFSEIQPPPPGQQSGAPQPPILGK